MRGGSGGKGGRCEIPGKLGEGGVSEKARGAVQAGVRRVDEENGHVGEKGVALLNGPRDAPEAAANRDPPCGMECSEFGGRAGGRDGGV